MNKFVYFFLLFSIIASSFFAGSFFTFGGQDLEDCEIYAAVYDEFPNEHCDKIVIRMFVNLIIFLIDWILLIFLTTKGWRKVKE